MPSDERSSTARTAVDGHSSTAGDEVYASRKRRRPIIEPMHADDGADDEHEHADHEHVV